MKNKITNAEMRERADIVAQTNANNLLEGITPIKRRKNDGKTTLQRHNLKKRRNNDALATL